MPGMHPSLIGELVSHTRAQGHQEESPYNLWMVLIIKKEENPFNATQGLFFRIKIQLS